MIRNAGKTHLPEREERILRTSAGDFPLDEYCFRLNEREWKVLHVGAVLSREEESNFLRNQRELLPYGVTLWAASIALAHEVASRAETFKDSRVLELGAGTGLPGIVAASEQTTVVQTDRNELAMSVCKRSLLLNKVSSIEQRLADWADWNDANRDERILGSDILYDKEMHSHLRRIFETNLAPGGKILLSDPFREVSFRLLEELEGGGWSITMSNWTIGEESAARSIGVFELFIV